ncbi:MAG: protein kinase domain-containing protein, partial [Streptosporangiaceae bacterium]
MRQDNGRWIEVTPSRFSHERAGLRRVHALFPDREPYRAWSNLEIITDRGRSLEVDLLVLAPGGLYLIELKAWSGRITGDRYTWRLDGGRTRTVDNPWRLANEKAKILKGLLVQAVGRRAREPGKRIDRRDVVPYVTAAVFLHGPDVRCDLPDEDRTFLYGLEGQRERTGLPGIISGLVTRQPPNPDRTVTATQAEVITGLMDHIGMTRRRKRTVGPYELDDEVEAEGPGWQDFLATHQRFRDERVRVRLYHTGASTSREQRATLTRAAEREYRLLRHLSHPGLVAPRGFYETDMGPALVYDHDPRFGRLDHLLAAHAGELPLATQLQIIRGVAEVLRYAHGRHITHRGLSPRSVLVRLRGDEPPLVRVADWQTAARSAATSTSASDPPGGPQGGAARDKTSLLGGTRHLGALVEDDTLVYLAPELSARREVDDVRADVFGLGAVAYLVLAGQPPAPDPARLRVRLFEQGGLDLAGVVDGVPEGLRALVLDATRGETGARLADVRAFLERLDEVEEELAGPAEPEGVDPLDATTGSVIDERWRLLRRLGSGATAAGLYVEDLADDGARKVLKVARDEGRAQRLRDEADVLRGLDDPHVVRLLDGPIDIGGRTVLVLEYAGDQTLATVLRQEGRPSLDWLERYGHDLLAAAAYLDAHGVDHRDVKPDNLGVRVRPGDRSKHLVLFDFSLARTPATEISAGTPPYLDPFLGPPRRLRFDAAAERYAVAVTLFEMATGRLPAYGDPRADPAVVEAEATVEPDMFDPAVAYPLVHFFRTVLR